MNQLNLFNIHKNSLEAFYSSKKSRMTRSHQIINLMLDEGPRTDRGIKTALGFEDMNAVRPRITELIEAGTLEEIGTMKDPITKKNVRILQLKANV